MLFYARLIVLSLVIVSVAKGQTEEDTLPEVPVWSYLNSQRPLLRLPASVARIDSAALFYQHGQSLVPVLNTVPGVRMEERSPGSYRLSVRGSVIRSPFGVRNIKTYIDDYPLTNGGGETYLNIIDQNVLRSLEIMKGPDGSLFGANSGGVLHLNTRAPNDTSQYLRVGAGAGSYGQFQENVQIRKKISRSLFGVDQGWIRSDGYRQHSQLNRKYFQLSNSLVYGEEGRLKALFFYSDHFYETPGGLTLAQQNENPRQARPATAFAKGAEEQNSSIRNRTFFGGLSNDIQLTETVRHVLSIFGSQTNFENPFITNYEIREEGNIGARSWIEIKSEGVKWEATTNIGGEYQEMESRIENYGNRSGTRDTVQAIDEGGARTGFVFARVNVSYLTRFQAEVSASYNMNSSYFQRQTPIPLDMQNTALTPQLMPRLAASYFFVERLSLRVIVSRGYSPPSLQEIRSSDNTINTSLQPESGWNREMGLRFRTKDERIWLDVSAFYFVMEQAIVRRINDAGQEYFENAGGTDQKGIESQVRIDLVKKRDKGFIRELLINNATTLSDFTFSKGDFSGKELTGVPREVFVTSVLSRFIGGIYVFVQHSHTSALPLNDLNTFWADASDVYLAKLGWCMAFRRFSIDVNGGVENIGNELYSLGHDLNAVGNRFYNPAPGINYFCRFGITF